MIELLEQYDYIDSFHEGLAAVWTNKGIGFLNTHGEMIIQPKYEKTDAKYNLCKIYRFSEGVSPFLQNGQYGLIDKWGYIVVSADYKSLSPLRECMSAAQLNQKWGFINHRGKCFIPFIYDFAQSFNNGLCWVRMNDMYGSIDQSGHVIIPFSNEYHSVNPFHCNVSVFTTFDAENDSCRYGVISNKGYIIIIPSYSYISDYNENLAYTSQKTYIDTVGKTVLYLPQYEQLRKFSKGRAFVKYNGKWGAINTNGELVIPAIYDNCCDFVDNYAAVKKDGKWGYIDSDGEIVLSLIYDYVTKAENDYVVVRSNNTWMIVKLA